MQIKHFNKLYTVFKGYFPFTLWQNGGCIPRVVQDVLKPVLHPNLCCNGTKNKTGQREAQDNMREDGSAWVVRKAWAGGTELRPKWQGEVRSAHLWERMLSLAGVARVETLKPSQASESRGRAGMEGWLGPRGQRVQVPSAWRAPARTPAFMLRTVGGQQVAWNRGETWDRLDVQQLLPAVGRVEPLGTGREDAGVRSRERVWRAGRAARWGTCTAWRASERLRSTWEELDLEEGDAAVSQALGFRDEKMELQSSEAMCLKSHSLNVWRQNPSRFSLSKPSLLFFFSFLFHWRRVALRCCVRRCCTAGWLGRVHTHPSSPGSPPHFGRRRAWAELPSSGAGAPYLSVSHMAVCARDSQSACSSRPCLPALVSVCWFSQCLCLCFCFLNKIIYTIFRPALVAQM